MSIISVTARNLPAMQAKALKDKTILTGPNGAGKTTILRCIEAALNGSLAVGRLEDYSDGKPLVELVRNKTVVGRYPGGSEGSDIALSLSALVRMTGPQRAAELFRLLKAMVPAEKIREAVDSVDADMRKLVSPILRMDVDAAIKWINLSKKESQRQLDGLRAITAESDLIAEDVANKELEALKAKYGRTDYVAERATTIAEMQKVTELLGEYVDREPAAMDTKINGWKAERARLESDLADYAAEVARLSRERDKIGRVLSAGSGRCPTCGHEVNEKEIADLQANYTAIQGKIEAQQSLHDELSAKKRRYDIAISQGLYVLKNLSRLYDLREYLKTLPESQFSPEEIAAAKASMEEYEQALRLHAAARENARKLREVEATTKAFRAVENALKAAKAETAAAAGFPEHVTKIVDTVLGMQLRFEKNDIAVFDGKQVRSVSTLSGGEWSVVAAAFAALKPTSWILVEGAEIDQKRLELLLNELVSLPNPVIVAHWASYEIKGYTVVEVNNG